MWKIQIDGYDLGINQNGEFKEIVAEEKVEAQMVAHLLQSHFENIKIKIKRSKNYGI